MNGNLAEIGWNNSKKMTNERKNNAIKASKKLINCHKIWEFEHKQYNAGRNVNYKMGNEIDGELLGWQIL